jgi:pimeloyl-ACP methyl ester carboxylesterase
MADPTLLDRLAAVDLPVHVIWGDSDGIAGVEYGRALAKAIPGAAFSVVPQAGHMPQLEAPEQLLRVIGEGR